MGSATSPTGEREVEDYLVAKRFERRGDHARVVMTPHGGSRPLICVEKGWAQAGGEQQTRSSDVGAHSRR